jgi:hypothetical protein
VKVTYYVLLILSFFTQSICKGQSSQILSFGKFGEFVIPRGGLLDNDGNHIFSYSTKIDSQSHFGVAFFNKNLNKKWSVIIHDDNAGYGPVKATTDSCYVISSVSNSHSHITKIDQLGNVIFAKKEPWAPNIYRYMCLDSLDNIYMVGDSGRKLQIAKLDKNGNTLWTKGYKLDTTVVSLRGWNIASKGSFLTITGQYSKLVDTIYKAGAVLLKTDLNGNIIWGKTYEAKDSVLFFANSIVTGNNEVIAVGNISVWGNWDSWDGIILKVDTNGDIVSNKRIGNQWHNEFNEIVSDGGTEFVISAVNNTQQNGGGSALALNISDNLAINYFRHHGMQQGAIFSNIGKRNGGFYSYGGGSAFSYFNNGNEAVCLLYDDSLNLPCKLLPNGLPINSSVVESNHLVISSNANTAFQNHTITLTDTLFVADVCFQEPLNVESQKHNYNLKIYPNPTSRDFNIECDLKLRKIKIYSLSGQLVQTVNSLTHFNSIKLENNGLYILQLESDNGNKFFHKLIVR